MTNIKRIAQKGKTMTSREFYTNIINTVDNDELKAKAQELLTALDARNEKRKSTESKEKKEANARREAVLAFIKGADHAVTRDEISVALGITPSQATSACSVLVRQEVLLKEEIRVDKSRKTAYSITE